MKTIRFVIIIGSIYFLKVAMISMNFIVKYQWEIFITIEILFLLAFLAFGFIRYFLNKRRLSLFFLGGFFSLLIIEATLAFYIYRLTGKISTFQIVIGVFVVYALTFGIFDFLKLDRWMRRKIGTWRHVELLSEKDYEIIARNKDPKYIARKYRYTSTIHLIIFIIAQAGLWYHGTGSVSEMLTYVRDLSWFETGHFEDSPYANEATYSIGMLWMIIFFIDFVWSWSYTLFPSDKKES